MQTGHIPLSLLGLNGFNYTRNDFSNVVYDPTKQVSKKLFATQGDRETVSDCSTQSGFFMNHDDEERDVDD